MDKRNNTRQKPLTKEEKQRVKKLKSLNSICRECGRERHIPAVYCQQCWQELKKII